MSTMVAWFLIFAGNAMNKQSPTFLGEFHFEKSCQIAAAKLVEKSPSLRDNLVCVPKIAKNLSMEDMR